LRRRAILAPDAITKALPKLARSARQLLAGQLNGSVLALLNRQTDVFHFQIVVDPMVAAFAAKTGLFDPAKRRNLG